MVRHSLKMEYLGLEELHVRNAGDSYSMIAGGDRRVHCNKHSYRVACSYRVRSIYKVHGADNNCKVHSLKNRDCYKAFDYGCF